MSKKRSRRKSATPRDVAQREAHHEREAQQTRAEPPGAEARVDRVDARSRPDAASQSAAGLPLRGRSRTLLVAATLVALIAAIGATASIVYRRHHPPFDMVARLADIASDEGAWDNPWDAQNKKIASLQQEIARTADPIRRLVLRRELASQYVNGGASEPAIAALEQLLVDYRGVLPPRDVETLKSDIAFAYFRLGELSNCTWNHNSDACIFPIAPGGVYKEQLGAREAAKRYTELLSDPTIDPDNVLVYRWLLNLSYMVLGQYPDAVPKQWLIPLDGFKSDYDIGLFRDVAATRGVAALGRAGSVAMEDFENNGHLDLMISRMGVDDQLEYFRNRGDGTFERRTEQAGLKGIVGGLNLVQADYDNDGCIDVYIPRGAWYHDKGQYPASLLHNNCDGTFTDVTAKAGVMNNYPSQVAVWADFNNDGLLDLFVGNEIVRDKVDWPADAKNFRLYINNGDGTFTDVGPQTGIVLNGMVKGATADDYDNDGRIDLYVSVMGGPNHLFRNVGNDGKVPKFVDVTAQAGVAEPNMSFTTWFFDYDNDGWPDIFVSGYWATMPNIIREYLGDNEHANGDRPRLYHNNHDGTFTDMSHAMHLDHLLLTMGANFGDLDNDGWLDFYVGTGAAPLNNIVPHQMFRNDEGRVFQNVTTSGGFGHLQKGHGVAFGDIDNSGNQDVFEVIGGAFTSDRFYSALFKNPGHGNHWIKLNLVGTKSNRFAVGGRIRVRITENGRPRDIYRTVNSGGSFGASSLRPHIGVGKATTIDAIEVRWPGSVSQTFSGPIAADATYEIREGGNRVVPVQPQPQPLPMHASR